MFLSCAALVRWWQRALNALTLPAVRHYEVSGPSFLFPVKRQVKLGSGGRHFEAYATFGLRVSFLPLHRAGMEDLLSLQRSPVKAPGSAASPKRLAPINPSMVPWYGPPHRNPCYKPIIKVKRAIGPEATVQHYQNELLSSVVP